MQGKGVATEGQDRRRGGGVCLVFEGIGTLWRTDVGVHGETFDARNEVAGCPDSEYWLSGRWRGVLRTTKKGETKVEEGERR